MYNASIKKIEEFVANVVCEFKLELFPFDVNVCTLTINIQNKGFSKTRFSVSRINLFLWLRCFL